MCQAPYTYVESYAERAGARDIVVVPSVVDPQRYPPRVERDDARMRIGWIGTPHTQRYLEDLAPQLARLQRGGDVDVQLVGASAAPTGVDAELVPWSEAGEGAAMARLDVGIMPLPDSPWERGKCGFKLVQYMAAGVPVVASPVGANCDIVEEGRNGFLAHAPSDWHRAFDLLRDRALRRRLGARARDTVLERYSLDVAAPRIVFMLRRAAGL